MVQTSLDDDESNAEALPSTTAVDVLISDNTDLRTITLDGAAPASTSSETVCTPEELRGHLLGSCQSNTKQLPATTAEDVSIASNTDVGTITLDTATAAWSLLGELNTPEGLPRALLSSYGPKTEPLLPSTSEDVTIVDTTDLSTISVDTAGATDTWTMPDEPIPDEPMTPEELQNNPNTTLRTTLGTTLGTTTAGTAWTILDEPTTPSELRIALLRAYYATYQTSTNLIRALQSNIEMQRKQMATADPDTGELYRLMIEDLEGRIASAGGKLLRVRVDMMKCLGLEGEDGLAAVHAEVNSLVRK